MKKIKNWGIPLLVLGGGGYTIKNVSRCWTYETAICLGMEEEIGDQIPHNDFYEYYGPDYNLHVTEKPDEDKNYPDYVQYIQAKCLQNLKELEGAPSVPFHEVPKDFHMRQDVESGLLKEEGIKQVQ